MARLVCAAELHARLRRDPGLLLKLTTPGARTAAEEPGCWVELRHCIACGATLSLAGEGSATRWLYAVERAAEEPLLFAPTLEAVRDLLVEMSLAPASVSRYLLGSYDQAPLTEGEAFWLQDALAAAASHDQAVGR